ncbi:cysteine methyltransferase [Arthrobacter livingstonensis]|uniref:Cysteine methyltransferase n=1 Tax=Arthrobacter livingstonensis TaxID=670078 RepID=A0A2V5LH59_9MICC|nr:MGMT family protein [Arthrobacter livingstonensis]PYI69333.1 cysteine methyltransferase [Arthrobacter livingstonensis]
MRAEYVEAVLDVVELIPAGRVLSYGDIAALLESGGPRQVGAVMSHHGSAVTWWRVIRAGGQPPLCHDAGALVHYREEETGLRGETGGEHPSWRVDMAAARWNPTEADFDLVDAIAARLHTAEEPPSDTAADVPAHEMSEPHGGLGA